MPDYVFSCPKCNNEVELTMKISEYHRPLCVEQGCDGQQEMQPKLSPTKFQLRGTGWTPKFAHGNAEGPSTDLVIPKKR